MKDDAVDALAVRELPSQQEKQTLIALFSAARFADAVTLAQTLTERYPLHGFGWKVLGAALKQLGQSAEALAPMQKASALAPNEADTHCNLGAVLKDLGQLDKAEVSCRLAVALKPDLADAYSNLGSILQDLAWLDEAIVSCHRALKVSPAFAAARCILGNILRAQGGLDDAGTHYRLALTLTPVLDEAYNNLGVALKDLGRLGEADVCYRRALLIRPDYATALNNLALLLTAQSRPTQALSAILQSLRIKETYEAKSIFVTCVKRQRFTRDDIDVKNILVRALNEPWGRPKDLAPIAVELIKFNPDIWQCVERAVDAWPVRLPAPDLLGMDGFAKIALDPLLIALLGSTSICGVEMERFLTMARCVMLEAAAGMEATNGECDVVLKLYGALTRQCFINEYIFSYTADEIRKASDLRNALVAALAENIQVSALRLLAVAAYFPLCSLPLAVKLLEFQWPEPVAAVLTQQVREPLQELQERESISRLTHIEDDVSLRVQAQYEENPYPRWVRAAPIETAGTVLGYLCQKFPLASFKRQARHGDIDILVAGCGTGQHPITTARLFPGARVLAVDLSLSSLAYAKRKTRELGLTSIDYAQADLLKLGALNRDFDVIESVGVLHHLADPWTGWQTLLSLLRPGGFMRLGFYSEVARRNIVRIHEHIAARGYRSEAEDIRLCRQELFDLDQSADFGITLKSPDFFSVSTCRDLLFHVQEHRMTLAGIAAFLRESELAFLGFDIDRHILHEYQKRFRADRAATDFGQWEIFESENPDTFGGMYQFWIQKPA